MNRNLPRKYNESLLRKFFRKLVGIWNSVKKCTQNEVEYDDVSNSRSNTIEDKKLGYLKFAVDVNDNTDFKRREFLSELINHPEWLEEFSEDRLEKILQWYIKENKTIEELLKKKGILN